MLTLLYFIVTFIISFTISHIFLSVFVYSTNIDYNLTLYNSIYYNHYKNNLKEIINFKYDFFSYIFGLSNVLFLAIILEIADVSNSSIRYVLWNIILWLFILIMMYVIPYMVIKSFIKNLSNYFFTKLRLHYIIFVVYLISANRLMVYFKGNKLLMNNMDNNSKLNNSSLNSNNISLNNTILTDNPMNYTNTNTYQNPHPYTSNTKDTSYFYINFYLKIENMMEFFGLVSIIFTSVLSGYSSIQCIFHYLVYPFCLKEYLKRKYAVMRKSLEKTNDKIFFDEIYKVRLANNNNISFKALFKNNSGSSNNNNLNSSSNNNTNSNSKSKKYHHRKSRNYVVPSISSNNEKNI